MTRLVKAGKLWILTSTTQKQIFQKLFNSLLKEKKDIIIISKNGKPVAQLTPILKKNSKRIGIAKEEMKDFDMSLDDFNAIKTLDFGL